MKIAYIVNTYPRASHSFIRREIHALERLGHSVHRFAMRSDRANLVDPADLAEDDLTEHVLAAPKWRIWVKGKLWGLGHMRASLRAMALAWRCGAKGGRIKHMIYLMEAAYIAARCHTLGITHIHAHFGTNSATVAMLAHAIGGPKYSFTTHGPEEFDAPATLNLAEKIIHAQFVVGISSYGRSQLCRLVPYRDWAKIKVVHCGIEPALFPEPAPLPRTLQLVAIGRFSEQKAFPILIDAMAIARKSLPELHLTLVGDGPLRPEIETAIAAQNLSENITLTGWLPEVGVRQALNNASVLVLPSFAEGLPMVVMEALASGRPVIATAIAGLPELVTSDCGWLVPAGDTVALADAMIASAQSDLAAMGMAGRKRALARHTIDNEARKLLALFQEAPND